MQVELNGLPVFIDTGGRVFISGLPTLLFIHGAQLDHFVWKPLVSRLAGDGLNVLAPDLPGHGKSAGTPLQSIEAMADWLASLLALLAKVSPGETAPLYLAGHSMGSLIALEAATRLAERVEHLFLLGTSIPMPVSPVLLEAARDDEPRAMALINRWSHSSLAWRGAIGGHGLWLPALNLRIMERQARDVLSNDLSACNAYRAGKSAAENIHCPVTIVAGSEDRMTSIKAANRVIGLIPHARLVELDGVGHALMAEAPGAIGNIFAETLSSSA